MNSLGAFTGEALLEQGKSLGQKTGDVARQGVKTTALTATSQLTGMSFSDGQAAPVDNSAQPSNDQQEFIKELYGSEHNQSNQTNPQAQASDNAINPNPQVDVKREEDLARTRHQLQLLQKQMHMQNYFEPTFNKKQEEESVSEKLEREEEEKKQEEFAKQEKKPDFALQRAQSRGEMSPGASG